MDLSKRRLRAGFSAGLIYFAVVFLIAFISGASRPVFLTPMLGEMPSVSLEVVVLVSVSWVAAQHLVQQQRVRLTLPARVLMGATAFVLTIACEAALAQTLRAQSISEWASAVATPLGLIGLSGQVAFGMMPILIRNGRRVG